MSMLKPPSQRFGCNKQSILLWNPDNAILHLGTGGAVKPDAIVAVKIIHKTRAIKTAGAFAAVDIGRSQLLLGKRQQVMAQRQGVGVLCVGKHAGIGVALIAVYITFSVLCAQELRFGNKALHIVAIDFVIISRLTQYRLQQLEENSR